ncbi:MAG: hypothetical protein PHU85_03050, partial [Phycisphaerae bacterium]|nr:hypothetical protein [Phycisphaerae bacterium]
MMQTAIRLTVVSLVATFATTAVFAQAKPKPKFTSAPGADLSKPILWGSECEVPDGPSLRFGGIDQKADDGAVHTAIKVDGQWKVIVDPLRTDNPGQMVSGASRDAAKTIGYWRELAYVPDADMILQVGASVAPSAPAGAGIPTTAPD